MTASLCPGFEKMARPKTGPKTGRIRTRDVECLDCGKVFPSAVKNARCGCGSHNVQEVGVTEDEVEEKARRRRKPAQMPLQPLPFVVDSDMYVKMQTLMNYGVGKNYEDVIKKSIDNMLVMRTGLVKGGDRIMADPEDTLDDIKRRELMDAEKRRIEADTASKQKEASPMQQITRFTNEELERRMAEAQLKRLERGESNPLENMLMMEYIKSTRGSSDTNPVIEELKKKLEVMEQERRFDDIKRSNDELKSMVLDVMKSKTGDTQESLITKMTQIFANRDTDMAKLQQEIQAAKDETRQVQLDAKLSRIEDKFQQLQGGKSELTQFSETFDTVKKIAQGLGEAKKPEKSGAELAQELISTTLDKISGPILTPIGAALAEKARGPPQFDQPQYMLPATPTPGGIKAVALGGPEANAATPNEEKTEDDYSDLVNVSGGQ